MSCPEIFSLEFELEFLMDLFKISIKLVTKSGEQQQLINNKISRK